MAETGSGPLEQLKSALADRELPTLYFNGFINSIGTGDVVIVLRRHGKPIAILNTSYPVAKTLAEHLGGMIAQFEQQTGKTVMTIDQIRKSLSEGTDDEVDR